MERSSRWRIGTFDSTVSLPPRCARKVRSETLPSSTPSRVFSCSTISIAWSRPPVSTVMSARIRSGPEAETSSAVTEPPCLSMLPVMSLTAAERAANSRRMVME